MIGNLLLYRLCWAGNIYVWSKYEINYIAVLQLSNSKPNLLLVANQSATLLLWYFINLMIYCRANMHDSILHTWWNGYLTYGCPFILLIVACIYQIYESIFLFGNEHISRGCFGFKVFRNMLLAPFSELRFRDVYVADVLTSFNRVIADTLYASCWILSGSFATPYYNEDPNEGLATSSHFGTPFLTCAYNPNMIYVVSCVQLWPLFTRTLQCLRAVRDSGYQFYPQGYNTIKYLLSILVVMIGLFAPTNKGLYYFSIVIATAYKWWWDVVMDWGLCEISLLPQSIDDVKTLIGWNWLVRYTSHIGIFSSTPPPTTTSTPPIAQQRGWLFLREQIMLPNIGLYYFAICIDLILRFLWVLSLLPPATLNDLGILGHQLSFFLGSVEIARRSMWGIIRVEYEHLKMLKQRAPGFLGNDILHKREEHNGNNDNEDNEDDDEDCGNDDTANEKRTEVKDSNKDIAAEEERGISMKVFASNSNAKDSGIHVSSNSIGYQALVDQRDDDPMPSHVTGNSSDSVKGKKDIVDDSSDVEVRNPMIFAKYD